MIDLIFSVLASLFSFWYLEYINVLSENYNSETNHQKLFFLATKNSYKFLRGRSTIET